MAFARLEGAFRNSKQISKVHLLHIREKTSVDISESKNLSTFRANIHYMIILCDLFLDNNIIALENILKNNK